MTANPNHDYLSIYDAAINVLDTQPDSLVDQHKAVLALARMGALDFATAEYKRYGLDKVRRHEDIMALGARLLKDYARISTGKAAQEYARQSAEKYEMAFQDTKGYYSGINAATMALLAGTPAAIYQDRVKVILDELPQTDDLDKHEVYFVEATRSEAYLLLGDKTRAETTLRAAIAHDPLNYTSHASTLRQFQMILNAQAKSQEHQNEDTLWDDSFRPPKAIHFCGHIFGLTKSTGSPSGHGGKRQSFDTLSKAQLKALKVDISDAIQRNDIGFGYGALAAGADITIAQTLLNEGAELHVILPTEISTFKAISVTPFGKRWVKRFETCLERATSLTITEDIGDWPTGPTSDYANEIAMGQAAMRAQTLFTRAQQLLIWDQEKPRHKVGTARDADMWGATGREQIILPFPVKRITKPATKSITEPMHSNSRLTAMLTLSTPQAFGVEARKAISEIIKQNIPADKRPEIYMSESEIYALFENCETAAHCAILIQEWTQKIGIDVNIGGHYGPQKLAKHNIDAKDKALYRADIGRAIIKFMPPNAVYVTAAFAAYLSAFHQNKFTIEFVGKINAAVSEAKPIDDKICIFNIIPNRGEF